MLENTRKCYKMLLLENAKKMLKLLDNVRNDRNARNPKNPRNAINARKKLDISRNAKMIEYYIIAKKY